MWNSLCLPEFYENPMLPSENARVCCEQQWIHFTHDGGCRILAPTSLNRAFFLLTMGIVYTFLPQTVNLKGQPIYVGTTPAPTVSGIIYTFLPQTINPKATSKRDCQCMVQFLPSVSFYLFINIFFLIITENYFVIQRGRGIKNDPCQICLI